MPRCLGSLGGEWGVVVSPGDAWGLGMGKEKGVGAAVGTWIPGAWVLWEWSEG